MLASRTSLRSSDIVVRAAIVALALATGYIHYTLGGLLFTLNAAGYAVAAVAMVVPLALAVRFRWVVRIGLIGYAATAIVMWAIQGPYYSTAYVAKAIEVALIVVLAVDFVRHDGSPSHRPAQARGLVSPPATACRRRPDRTPKESFHEAPHPHPRPVAWPPAAVRGPRRIPTRARHHRTPAGDAARPPGPHVASRSPFPLTSVDSA
jgi:hypothetical protein